MRDWIGLPYRAGGRGPDAYDCMGLYLALHEARTGERLPDPVDGVSHHTALKLNRYRRVDPAEVVEGDALLFRGLANGALHIGYALDRRDMLHIGGDGFVAHPPSCVERWDASHWRRRLEGCYRC